VSAASDALRHAARAELQQLFQRACSPPAAGRPDPMDTLLQLPRRVLLGLVRAYRLLFSAWIGRSAGTTPVVRSMRWTP
jgi:hypothetical protein